MRDFDKLQYTLDGEPVSASDLIREASALNEAYAADWLKSTSEAARILRDNGSTVGTADA